MLGCFVCRGVVSLLGRCWGVERNVERGVEGGVERGVERGVAWFALRSVLQAPPFLLLVLEKRVDKLLLVEQLQSLHRLAQTDIFYRHLELVADADDHAALGCAVELGDG